MAITGLFTGGNEAPITELYVFLSTDAKGNDGIVSAQFGNVHLPLVTSKPRVAEMMKEHAREIARLSGGKITLARFTNREDMATINV